MEGKAQAAFIQRPSSSGAPFIASLTGVGFFLDSVKETHGGVFLICMSVNQRHDSTKTFRAITFTISGLTRALRVIQMYRNMQCMPYV